MIMRQQSFLFVLVLWFFTNRILWNPRKKEALHVDAWTARFTCICINSQYGTLWCSLFPSLQEMHLINSYPPLAICGVSLPSDQTILPRTPSPYAAYRAVWHCAGIQTSTSRAPALGNLMWLELKQKSLLHNNLLPFVIHWVISLSQDLKV